MKLVYVESTVPSYLAARPSRDALVLQRQRQTRKFWSTARERFHLFVAETVLVEIKKGDSALAAKRIEIVSDLKILQMSPDVDELLGIYSAELQIS